MTTSSFSLSFTSGGLYTREAVRYAQRLVAGLSHEQIKTEIFEQNIFVYILFYTRFPLVMVYRLIFPANYTRKDYCLIFCIYLDLSYYCICLY